VIGHEAPATIENCYVGPSVALKGGFFRKAAFLKNSSMGSGAHVREGTILEEHASGAHTVGLKQTILFPFVTLGSLINFCDCLMSGGTGRNDHSEVGSSYIHFNFTPNQDKATPSLLGNVPQGVMLDQRPIFLGGQGGLIGPLRLAFGTIVAAGTLCRKDELRPNRLIYGGSLKSGNLPVSTGMYRNIERVVMNNVIYIANLIALLQWYTHLRSLLLCEDFPEPLLEGLKITVNIGIDERIRQLKKLCEKMPEAMEIYKKQAGENASDLIVRQKTDLFQQTSELEAAFSQLRQMEGNLQHRDTFLEIIPKKTARYGRDYITVMKNLTSGETTAGILWLREIVDRVTIDFFENLPAFRYQV
jgi:UDP-N-acetylglucosamine/UDP-N-acetylgalactosamine diphosphorylase